MRKARAAVVAAQKAMRNEIVQALRGAGVPVTIARRVADNCVTLILRR